MSSSSPTRARILYEDHHLIAVNKPAGLVVHAGTGHPQGLVDQVREMLAFRHGQDRRWERVAPVHRLDKDTSGIVLFGKTEAALRKMAHLFESGQVEKQYLVLCKGVTHKKGKITVPLLARPERGGRHGANEPESDDEEGGDPYSGAMAELPEDVAKKKEEALTTYRRLINVKGLSLLVVQPHTGRTHQIRRHLKALAHPVAGDVRWGDAKFNYFLQRHGLLRPFIHAAALSFPHPLTQEPVTLRAALPPELMAVLASLGFVAPRPPWGPAPVETATSTEAGVPPEDDSDDEALEF